MRRPAGWINSIHHDRPLTSRGFRNSGAEANVAHDRFGSDKYEITAVLNSFHGRTLGHRKRAVTS